MKTLRLIALNFILVSSFSPFLALAQTGTTTPAQNNFCDQIAAGSITVSTLTSTDETTLKNALTKLQTIDEARTLFDNEWLVKAHTAQKAEATNFSKLLERVTSNDERAAVMAFQNTIQAAELARESAVGNAAQTFRTNLDASLKNSVSLIQQAFDAYKKSIQSAIDITESNCSKVPADVAQSGLSGSITAGKKTFRNAVKKIQSKQNLQALVDKRKAAINAANTTFTTTLGKALSDLKDLYPDI